MLWCHKFLEISKKSSNLDGGISLFAFVIIRLIKDLYSLQIRKLQIFHHFVYNYTIQFHLYKLATCVDDSTLTALFRSSREGTQSAE